MASPNKALARFTNDSIASDNNPIEPDTHHARVLSTKVANATTTDTRNRLRGVSHADDRGEDMDIKAFNSCICSGARCEGGGQRLKPAAPSRFCP